MCFGPSTLGAGAKTCLETKIKKFTSHCVCRTTDASIPADATIDLHLYESRNAFIQLFVKDGKTLEIGQAKNTGSFTWKVPDLTPSDDYYIKATWTEYRSVLVDSEEFEVVEGVVSVKPYTVDNNAYIHNQDIVIEWGYTGLAATEKVDLRLVQYVNRRDV